MLAESVQALILDSSMGRTTTGKGQGGLHDNLHSLTVLPASSPYHESVPGFFHCHVSGCWHQVTQSADAWFQWFTRTDRTALRRKSVDRVRSFIFSGSALVLYTLHLSLALSMDQRWVGVYLNVKTITSTTMMSLSLGLRVRLK